MPTFVYMMASSRNGTIYTGSTNDLPRRVSEHREGVVDGFTRKYGCKLLVWFEVHEDIFAARFRERQIKEWKRGWKLELVEANNPTWRDLPIGLLP